MSKKERLSPEPVAEAGDTSLAGTAWPLIMTKIQVPRRRSDLLLRRRLVEFIHTHLDRKLILISAPAGYGKTTLLTDFANDTDLPTCWYTLDPFDRDLHVFLEHLVAAIATRFPAFGERSRALLRNVTDPGRNLYPIVATLVQEIYDTIPEYFVLVLDDHHAVEDQEQINEFLDLFVTYVDENCNLVIASRTLPALPNLSLLVARRMAAGLSIDELRFTPQEIQELALQNYDLRPSPQQAEILAQRTGGWITGLLLSVAPRWEQDQGKVPLRGRINVNLYDYLSRQVLEQQPPELQDFLLGSSVLDELDPALCSTVLEVEHPLELMDQLRARNLFVTEFEGGGDRLRYHDLFRDFLQTTLCRRDKALFRLLTRRAAAVYAKLEEWDRAVSRYQALEEHESVAEIIGSTATELFEGGRWDTLASWLDALPEEIMAKYPRFLVHRAKIYADRNDRSSALALYEKAMRSFAAVNDDAWMAYALAQESSVLRYQGQYAKAMAHCLEALTLVTGETEREQTAMALARKNAGLCQLRVGQLAEGVKELNLALHLYSELDCTGDVGQVYHDLGLAHELAGDLGEAGSNYQAALERWRELKNPGPWANTLNGLGVVYHLQGKYDEALSELKEALTKAQQAGDLRVEAFTWASLGDLHRDLRDFAQAEQAYTEGLQVANRAGEGFIITYILDALGNAFRQRGDLTRARQLLQEALEHAQKHGSDYEIGLCSASLGVLAAEEHDVTTAHNRLDQAIALFEAGGFKRELARTCLYRSRTIFSEGEHDQALFDLERALALVAQLGSEQLFLAEGRSLLPLLRYADGQWTGLDSLAPLLDKIEAFESQLELKSEPVVQVEPKSVLRICALGQALVELDGRVAQWPTKQSRDIFFCLLQHPQGRRKDELGAIFWPNHEPHKLDSIFRSTLYRLRRTLFREIVIFDDGVYCVNQDIDYWYDVEAFEQVLDKVLQETSYDAKVLLLEEALSLYQGDYLEGLYADWCALERERLRERFRMSLEILADQYSSYGRLQQAIELHRRVLVEDPYQETAHQGLMRCYFQLGDRAAAVRQYQICVDILRKDLGLNPMPETEDLYLQIID